MNKTIRSTKGFTLVEIMIVVVIIGLLAAMAIPAFEKVRVNSIGKAMVNDARQIAGACQQILLDNPGVFANNVIPLVYVPATGAISSGVADPNGQDYLTPYVQKISKGYAGVSNTYAGNSALNAAAFTISHGSVAPNKVNPNTAGLNAAAANGAPVSFDTEGKPL